MATLRLDKFNGLIPRIDASLIPEGSAQVAHNLVLKSGKIVPLRAPENRGIEVFLENDCPSLADAKTIYAWKRIVAGNEVTSILAWPGVVHIAETNIADDDRDRIFVSGETGIPHDTAYMDEPAAYFNNRLTGTICRRTIIKQHPSAPAVSAVADGSTGEVRNTVFFQTWVDKYGYESPCSDASNEIEYVNGQMIHIAATTSPDSQAVARRIYKTITGDNSAENHFVIEFNGTDAWSAHDFAVRDEDCGEVMPRIEPPPRDLRCMTYIPGGYYAGCSRSKPKTVFFSDISLPYSWPIANQYDIHDNVVGIVSTKNTVFVLTDNRVWILRGTAPDVMVASALSPAACVSEQSIVEYNNNVFFCTNYGYCMVHNTASDGDVVTNFTDKFFTKEQWQALNPSSCRAIQIDGRIMAFFTVSGETKGYIFDLNESACMLTTHEVKARCMCVHRKSDEMFFVEEV